MIVANAFLAIALHAIYAVAFPLSGPTVALDGASAVGVNSGTVQKFLGIPFAQPPYASVSSRFLNGALMLPIELATCDFACHSQSATPMARCTMRRSMGSLAFSKLSSCPLSVA